MIYIYVKTIRYLVLYFLRKKILLRNGILPVFFLRRHASVTLLAFHWLSVKNNSVGNFSYTSASLNAHYLRKSRYKSKSNDISFICQSEKYFMHMFIRKLITKLQINYKTKRSNLPFLLIDDMTFVWYRRQNIYLTTDVSIFSSNIVQQLH